MSTEQLRLVKAIECVRRVSRLLDERVALELTKAGGVTLPVKWYDHNVIVVKDRVTQPPQENGVRQSVGYLIGVCRHGAPEDALIRFDYVNIEGSEGMVWKATPIDLPVAAAEQYITAVEMIDNARTLVERRTAKLTANLHSLNKTHQQLSWLRSNNPEQFGSQDSSVDNSQEGRR